MLKLTDYLYLGSAKYKEDFVGLRILEGDIIPIGGGRGPSYIDVLLSGVSPLVLTNAISLNYLKLFGGTEQRNIPSKYTQVEYLQSSGTQYIDTGYKPNSNTTISIKYYPAVSSNFMCLYGTQDSQSLKRFYGLISSTQFRVQVNSNAGSTPSFWGINKDGTLSVDTNGTFAQTQGTVTLGVDNKNKLISVKSDEYTGNISASGTVLGDNLDCQYNMLLLSRSTAGTAANNFSGRLYSFVVKENDTIIQNLIPARRNSDNVLGMYDTVTGNFLTNSGTGTFTAGSNTVPSPDTPMNIVSNNGVIKVSPNLFTRDRETLGKFYDASGVEQDGAYPGYYFAHTDFIKVKPNTTYTFGLKAGYATISGGSLNHRVIGWTSSKSYVKEEINVIEPPSTETGTLLYGTFKTSATTEYVTINFLYAPLETEIQLVQGSNLPATYRPYGQIYTDGTVETVEIDTTGDTATAEMLLKVGTYKDEQSVINGSVTRNVGIKVFDGSEDWKATYQGFFDAPLPDHIASAPAYCNYFQSVTTGTVPPAAERANKVWLGSTWVGLGATTKFSTVNAFKQWLATQYVNGTPVIVVYPLAESTTETVTAQPLTVQTGTNIVTITQVSIDDLTMELSYKQEV